MLKISLIFIITIFLNQANSNSNEPTFYQNLIYHDLIEVPSLYLIESYNDKLVIENEYDCLSKCNSNSKCIYSLSSATNLCNLYDYRARFHLVKISKKTSVLFQKLKSQK